MVDYSKSTIDWFIKFVSKKRRYSTKLTQHFAGKEIQLKIKDGVVKERARARKIALLEKPPTLSKTEEKL